MSSLEDAEKRQTKNNGKPNSSSFNMHTPRVRAHFEFSTLEGAAASRKKTEGDIQKIRAHCSGILLGGSAPFLLRSLRLPKPFFSSAKSPNKSSSIKSQKRRTGF